MAIFSSPLSWSKNNSVMVLVHLLNCSCLETLNVSFVMHRCFVFANCLLILLFNYDYLCAVALYMHLILQYILFGFYIDVISLFESFPLSAYGDLCPSLFFRHSFSSSVVNSFTYLCANFNMICRWKNYAPSSSAQYQVTSDEKWQNMEFNKKRRELY